MNLKEFKFPSASGNFGFSTLKTDPKLLEEAKKRGFYEEKTPYNALFSELFFSGGKLNFKKDLPEDFKSSATDFRFNTSDTPLKALDLLKKGSIKIDNPK